MNQTHVSEDEIPCDFSSIMDTGIPPAPSFTGDDSAALKGMHPGNDYEPRPRTFLEQYLFENPNVTFTKDSVISGMTKYMVERMGEEPLRQAFKELRDRWANVGNRTMTEPNGAAKEDPVGQMINHFAIFYEHVCLLEGYPQEAQPKVDELRLLGLRIHNTLLNKNGTLNEENVKRAKNANMEVDLLTITGQKDGSKNGLFLQVSRGKAVLRQRV